MYDEEFGDDFGWEPPPDPSMRTWRHPSEIAAAARAAQAPEPRSPRLPLAIINRGGLALTMAAVAAVPLLYLGLRGPKTTSIEVSDDGGQPAVLVDEPLATPTTEAPATSTEPSLQASTTSSTETPAPPVTEPAEPDDDDVPNQETPGQGDQASADEGPDTAAMPEPTGEAAPGSDSRKRPGGDGSERTGLAGTVYSCNPAIPQTGDALVNASGTTHGDGDNGAAAVTIVAGEAPTGSYYPHLSRLPAATDHPTGIYQVGAPNQPKPRVQLVAQFLAVDEMVFTSATAIRDIEFLVLNTGTEWFAVTQLSADLTLDVAAVDAAPPEQGSLRAAVSGWLTPNADLDFTTQSHWVELAGKPGSGKVFATNSITMTSACRPAYDTMATSLVRPSHSAGAAIMSDGQVVGMALGTSGYLVAGTPIAEILSFGVSAYNRGLPDGPWLGIETAQSPTSSLRVATVDPRGPGAQAGLRADDRLVSINGVRIQHPIELVAFVRRLEQGESVKVGYARGQDYRRATLTPKW